MPVKNVECQLAEMQIGRYVSGELLSAEALRQLEAHVASCSSCSRVLADRRKALNSMLTHGFAAVSTDLQSDNKEHLLIQALKEKAKAGAPKPAPAEASPEPTKNDFSSKLNALLGAAKNPTNQKKGFSKPLIYCAALAAVLMGMGYVTRGSGSILGDSAENAFPSKNEPSVNHNIPARSTEAGTKSGVHKNPSSSSPKAGAESTISSPAPGASEGAQKISEGASKTISTPLDSSSNNDADEPQPAPASFKHSHRSRIAAQKRHAIHHRESHKETPKPHRHNAVAKVTIYDENGTPLGK